MPTPAPARKTKTAWEPPGFDVTCIVGRVVFDDGDRTPHEAALTLIGKHGADGHYTYPSQMGTTVHVTIETEDDRPEDEDDA